jgi:hypothetical protein
MDPVASSGDLVYVSAGTEVDVFTYPGGKRAGTLSSGFDDATALCPDANGNIWIVNLNYFAGSTLVEYAHGGTSPIATLQDIGSDAPQACAVDPATGNLAVANMNANVAVFANAAGSPKSYSTQGLIKDVRTVTYDGNGNLYMRSFSKPKAAAWLPKGSSTVLPFLVRKMGDYDWDGESLVVAHGVLPTSTLFRYSLSGSSGTKIGRIRLQHCQEAGVFSLEGSELAVICGAGVTYYKYPAGGDPIKILRVKSTGGVAISLAP